MENIYDFVLPLKISTSYIFKVLTNKYGAIRAYDTICLKSREFRIILNELWHGKTEMEYLRREKITYTLGHNMTYNIVPKMIIYEIFQKTDINVSIFYIFFVKIPDLSLFKNNFTLISCFWKLFVKLQFFLYT